MKKSGMLLLFMLILKSGFACNECDGNQWMAEGMFGMAGYSSVHSADGKTPVARLSLGHGLFANRYARFSLEAGIQSSNTLRLSLPKESIDVLGGVPIEARLNPMLDILMGIRTGTSLDFPMYAWVKGGLSWRQMQVDSESVNNLQVFSPEVQAGIGYKISEKASLNLGYQYITGKNPVLTVNEAEETGILNNIPAQQAIMLGFAFNFW